MAAHLMSSELYSSITCSQHAATTARSKELANSRPSPTLQQSQTLLCHLSIREAADGTSWIPGGPSSKDFSADFPGQQGTRDPGGVAHTTHPFWSQPLHTVGRVGGRHHNSTPSPRLTLSSALRYETVGTVLFTIPTSGLGRSDVRP